MVAMVQTMTARPSLVARPARQQQMRARRALSVRSQAAGTLTMPAGEIKDKTAELAINGGSSAGQLTPTCMCAIDGHIGSRNAQAQSS